MHRWGATENGLATERISYFDPVAERLAGTPDLRFEKRGYFRNELLAFSVCPLT